MKKSILLLVLFVLASSALFAQQKEFKKAIKNGPDWTNCYHVKCTIDETKFLSFIASHPQYSVVSYTKEERFVYGDLVTVIHCVFKLNETAQQESSAVMGDFSKLSPEHSRTLLKALKDPKSEDGVKIYEIFYLSKKTEIRDCSKGWDDWLRTTDGVYVITKTDEYFRFTTKDQVDLFKQNNKFAMRDDYEKSARRSGYFNNSMLNWYDRNNFYVEANGPLFAGRTYPNTFLSTATGEEDKYVYVKQYDKIHIWANGHYLGCFSLIDLSRSGDNVQAKKFGYLKYDESIYKKTLASNEYAVYAKCLSNNEANIREYFRLYGTNGQYYKSLENNYFQSVRAVLGNDYLADFGHGINVADKFMELFPSSAYRQEAAEIKTYAMAFNKRDANLYTSAYPSSQNAGKLRQLIADRQEYDRKQAEELARRREEERVQREYEERMHRKRLQVVYALKEEPFQKYITKIGKMDSWGMIEVDFDVYIPGWKSAGDACHYRMFVRFHYDKEDGMYYQNVSFLGGREYKSSTLYGSIELYLKNSTFYYDAASHFVDNYCPGVDGFIQESR